MSEVPPELPDGRRARSRQARRIAIIVASVGAVGFALSCAFYALLIVLALLTKGAEIRNAQEGLQKGLNFELARILAAEAPAALAQRCPRANLNQMDVAGCEIVHAPRTGDLYGCGVVGSNLTDCAVVVVERALLDETNVRRAFLAAIGRVCESRRFEEGAQTGFRRDFLCDEPLDTWVADRQYTPKVCILEYDERLSRYADPYIVRAGKTFRDRKCDDIAEQNRGVRPNLGISGMCAAAAQDMPAGWTLGRGHPETLVPYRHIAYFTASLTDILPEGDYGALANPRIMAIVQSCLRREISTQDSACDDIAEARLMRSTPEEPMPEVRSGMVVIGGRFADRDGEFYGDCYPDSCRIWARADDMRAIRLVLPAVSVDDVPAILDQVSFLKDTRFATCRQSWASDSFVAAVR